MDPDIRFWVGILEEDMRAFQRAAEDTKDHILRALYTLQASKLQRAIDRFILGMTFAAISERAKRVSRDR